MCWALCQLNREQSIMTLSTKSNDPLIERGFLQMHWEISLTHCFFYLFILFFFFSWTKQGCFLGELFLFNSRSKENQKHFFPLYLSYVLLIQMTVSTVRMINKSYWYSMWYKVKQINHAVWLYLFFCDISGRKRLESGIHAKLSTVTVPSL